MVPPLTRPARKPSGVLHRKSPARISLKRRTSDVCTEFFTTEHFK
jgi:hypothetical protein